MSEESKIDPVQVDFQVEAGIDLTTMSDLICFNYNKLQVVIELLLKQQQAQAGSIN